MAGVSPATDTDGWRSRSSSSSRAPISSLPPAGPGRSTSTPSTSPPSHSGGAGPWPCRRWWRPACSTAAWDWTASPTRPTGRDSPCSRFPTTRSPEGFSSDQAARRWHSWPGKRQRSSRARPRLPPAWRFFSFWRGFWERASEHLWPRPRPWARRPSSPLMPSTASPNRCWRSWPRLRCGHWRAGWRPATLVSSPPRLRWPPMPSSRNSPRGLS